MPNQYISSKKTLSLEFPLATTANAMTNKPKFKIFGYCVLPALLATAIILIEHVNVRISF